MKRNFLLAICLLAFAGITSAQSLAGNWAAYYDYDLPGKALKNKDIAVVTLATDASGNVYSTISSVRNGFASQCQNCPGDKANKPTASMVWAKDLKPVAGKPGEFDGGWAIDPQTGKTATNVKAKMIDPNTIMVTCTEEGTGKARSIKLVKQ